MLTKTDNWILAWVGLCRHTVTIFTLGFVDPTWEIDVLQYFFLKRLDEWVEKHPEGMR
jgi:hypothetical protein